MLSIVYMNEMFIGLFHSRNHKQKLVEAIAARLNMTVAEVTSNFIQMRSHFNRAC